jgi:MOSC domain-containing protein YiiM
MPTVTAVCISAKKGIAKRPVDSARLVEEHGLENDAHAGNWHRQVSLLSLQKIEDFKKRGALVRPGDFGENIIADIDFASLPVGTRLSVGDALLEITQLGKECHTHCAIYHSMGECIMPTQGVFAKVLRGGEVKAGDDIAVLTAASPLADKPDSGV